MFKGQLGLTPEVSSVLNSPRADGDGGGHVHRGPDHLDVTFILVPVGAASHLKAAWTQRDREQDLIVTCIHIQSFSRLTSESEVNQHMELLLILQ